MQKLEKPQCYAIFHAVHSIVSPWHFYEHLYATRHKKKAQMRLQALQCYHFHKDLSDQKYLEVLKPAVNEKEYVRNEKKHSKLFVKSTEIT